MFLMTLLLLLFLMVFLNKKILNKYLEPPIEKNELQSFNYDYIFYNSLNIPINLTVEFLNIEPASYLIQPYSYENWKTRLYYIKKIYFNASVSSNYTKIPLFIEGKSFYLIEPIISYLNPTIILTISDQKSKFL